MIAKVVRGWRPGGLLAYLFGPGKHEEHRDPRVVASWDGAPWLHQPDKLAPVVLDGEVLEPGEFDFDLKQLVATMVAPPVRAGLPTSNPPALPPGWADLLRSGSQLPPEAPSWLRYYKYDPRADAVVLRPGYVWHCPVRLHPDDPTLSDEQWRHIAERLIHATGIDQAGCRWVAVRHADDHVHLVATLVSEHTGKRFHPRQDWPKLREECRRLERELGLFQTAGIDRTAAPAPSRAEVGKAQRLGRATTARQELRRRVARHAAGSCDPAGFLRRLSDDGLDPKTVLDEAGRTRGYTVALPGDRTADGEPVRFSGSKLAPDLSWPKLMTRWAGVPDVPVPRTESGRVTPAERHDALRFATNAAERAVTAIRTGTADTAGIAHAVGEVLAVLSHGQERHEPDPLTDVADRYDRAARTPWRAVPTGVGSVALELRLAARRIAAVGALTGRGHERLAGLALVLALAGLVAEVAAWQQVLGRTHQAAAAGQTARRLPELARTMSRSAPVTRPPIPTPPSPVAHRWPGHVTPREPGRRSR